MSRQEEWDYGRVGNDMAENTKFNTRPSKSSMYLIPELVVVRLESAS